MKVLGGIVTYNPDISLLKSCIQALVAACEQVVIIDNGSSNVRELADITSNDIRIIENRANLGIAKALNQMFETARKDGFEWVLTLDQDTIVPSSLLNEAEELLKRNDIAVVCPRIHDVISGEIWPQINDFTQTIYVDRCITSGSVNSVRAWETIGGFDEYLFIDEVDHDFCYRLSKNGYKICLLRNVVIDHKIGETQVRKLFGKKIFVRNHSAFRKYYICRNILYMSRKYYGRIRLNAMVHVLAFTGKTALFEKNKGEQISACFRGIRDGIRG